MPETDLTQNWVKVPLRLSKKRAVTNIQPIESFQKIQT